MNKGLTIIALLMVMTGTSVLAQTDLQPFVGWHFGGKWRFYEGEVKLKSAVSYGITLDHEIRNGIMIEAYYSQMSTTAEWRPAIPRYEFLLPSSFKVDVHYFQLGGLKYIDKGNIQPFGAFTLGATWFHNYDPVNDSIVPQDYSSDITLFSITLGAGVKVMLSEKIGIRLQGRLLMPMYFNGFGLFVGGGSGGVSGGLGVSTSIPIVQGDLTAALVFRLGGTGE